MSVGLNQEDWDTNRLLDLLQGVDQSFSTLCNSLLSDLVFLEMDDEIDLDNEHDWVDEASDVFCVSLIFMKR